jgi:hypothetical protein
MSDNPNDWYMPTTIDDEPAYLVTREGIVFFTMKSDGKVPAQAQAEIAQIVTAWWRGEIFPRRAAPVMTSLFEIEPHIPEPPSEHPAPIEIVGGVSGLQKLFVKMAEENRGLDHAALKELFDTHEVVTAVWGQDWRPGLPHLERRRSPACAGQARLEKNQSNDDGHPVQQQGARGAAATGIRRGGHIRPGSRRKSRMPCPD